MVINGDLWDLMGFKDLWWFNRYTLWSCQNSYWSHGPVEIVDLHMNSMVDLSSSFSVNVYQAG